MELWKYPLLLVAGFICGIFNAMAGGGAVFTVPILITIFGLPSTVANGTNRIGILVQNFFATLGFAQKKVFDFKSASLLSIPAVIGAIIGSILATKISDLFFNKVIAIVMVFVVIMIFFKPQKKVEVIEKKSTIRTAALYIAFFFVGLYGGFVQIGVGLIILSVTTFIADIRLVQGNSYKVFIFGVYTLASTIIFGIGGKIDWPIGLVLAVGSGLGGWVGSQLAVAGGDKWIKIIMTIMVAIMSSKLLGLF